MSFAITDEGFRLHAEEAGGDHGSSPSTAAAGRLRPRATAMISAPAPAPAPAAGVGTHGDAQCSEPANPAAGARVLAEAAARLAAA